MKVPHLPLHTRLIICGLFVLLAACNTNTPTTVYLTYTNHNISKELDSMNSNRPITLKSGMMLSMGIVEQASANCFDSATHAQTCVQDVLSSMYLDTAKQVYNCVTTTVFHLPGGDITAIGMFKLPLGDTIPPDHDFPIVGGSGVYANIYGTYTRHYRDTVYHVVLRYMRNGD
jgi:hypothetical protein